MIVLLVILAGIAGFGMGYSFCAAVDAVVRWVDSGKPRRWLDWLAYRWEDVILAVAEARAWLKALWTRVSVWLLVELFFLGTRKRKD